METIIETRALSFFRREERILHEVSFSVNRGDFAALIGANGAGKSTLIQLLLHELTPAGGEALLFGVPAGKFRDWPRIGYVPQNGVSLAEGFPATVAEIVGTGLAPRRGAGRREAVRKALAMVDMQDYSQRMIGRLSGGQTQRVLIARALAGNCDLLLLDEPTTGIDSRSSESLYQLLHTLNRQRGLTILAVTHDIARLSAFCTRTLCLEQGSVVELGREQLEHELAHRHRHPHID